MGSFPGTSEIVESNEELNPVHLSYGSKTLNVKLKPNGKSCKHPDEDDLDRLIRAIDIRTSTRSLGPSGQASVDLLRRNALKKPVKVGGSEIGISESVTLKQALRKVCISQASEMAAMKRLSKPIGISGISEAGTIKRLYASVVVKSSDPDIPLNVEKSNLVEISIMPEEILTESSSKATKCSELPNLASANQMPVSSRQKTASNKSRAPKVTIKDVIKPSSVEIVDSSLAALEKEDKAISKASVSSLHKVAASSKPIVVPRLVKPVIRNKTGTKKKVKRELASASNSSNKGREVNKTVTVHGTKKSSILKEPFSPSLKSPDSIDAHGPGNIHNSATTATSSPVSFNAGIGVSTKTNECSRPREKGESSQSSKSSIGDYSSSTSISNESHQSAGSSNGSRPHMSKDARWVAIRQIAIQQGGLGLKNFKLLKRLGCGDIGTVYLAELVGTECLFALKVMDIDFLVSRKKMMRAQTEREILQMLDHPFLPTLYAHFTADNLLCLVMEFCPGGDLHVLRQKQPGRCFSEPAARFYVAEVLLALEYLHMLGVIYRDLKPENILVREDGHIMLSDFDLSLRCSVSPTLVKTSLEPQEHSKKLSGPCPENSCIDPLCLQPSWVQVSCFTPRLLPPTTPRARKVKADSSGQVTPLPQLIVEPTDARSNSFVGTHEYLAPEIIRGDGHGSAVDWWTFGIFLYELLYGRTPFKGPGNDETLANVVSQSLKFPENPAASFHARDLIRGLLAKEPENRLGFMKGAAEIKQHPFFEGLNWALIRCAAPPETPSCEIGTPVIIRKKKEGKCLDFRTNGEDVEFELF